MDDELENMLEEMAEESLKAMCLEASRQMLAVFSGYGIRFNEDDIERFAEPLAKVVRSIMAVLQAGDEILATDIAMATKVSFMKHLVKEHGYKVMAIHNDGNEPVH